MSQANFSTALRNQIGRVVRAHEKTLQRVAAGEQPLPESLHAALAAVALGLAAEGKAQESQAVALQHSAIVRVSGEHEPAVTSVLSLIYRRCMVEQLEAQVRENEIAVRKPKNEPGFIEEHPGFDWLQDCGGTWSVVTASNDGRRVTSFVTVAVEGMGARLTHKLVMAPYKAFLAHGKQYDGEAAMRGMWEEI